MQAQDVIAAHESRAGRAGRLECPCRNRTRRLALLAAMVRALVIGAMPIVAAPAAFAQNDAAASSAGVAKPWLSLAQLRAKYGDPKGKIARIGGVEVYYKDEGHGPAILLIHGSQGSLKTYDRLAARLIANYRVIRFDIPAQGLSGSVSDEAMARLQPTDIPEQLLAQLGVNKVTIVGVSSGGTMGVQLAAKRPDLVERLIVSNAPADPVVTDKQVMTPAFEAALAENKRLGYGTLSYWTQFFSFYAGDPKRYDAAFFQQIYDMNRRAPEKYPVGLVAKVADHAKAVDAMNRVTSPVLLIWGGADPLLPFSAMDVLAGYLKQARVSKLMLADVGHYPPVEIPERYAQLVRSYIEAAIPDAALKR